MSRSYWMKVLARHLVTSSDKFKEQPDMRNIKWIFACLFIMLMSESFASAQKLDVSRFDEFGDVNCEDEKARLDNFAVQLQSNTGSVGYVIVYGGSYGRRGEAQARASRIKSYLVKSRGLSLNSIKTVDGGYMERLTIDLWIVPDDLAAPPATPTLQPNAVRFKKGKIKRQEYGVCEP